MLANATTDSNPETYKVEDRNGTRIITLDEKSFNKASGFGEPHDIGRTVRSGYAYGFDSTDAVSQAIIERAAAIHEELGDEPLHGTDERYVYRFVKRTFDILFSSFVLVAFSWLFIIVAIAVKVDDPSGPVFFKQKRVGKNGKTFYMYKFRSMCVDAEEKLADLKELNEKSGPVFKIADDPRITRVGKVIRKVSLDEMPQFFNVLRSDMSLVGPRPALPSEVKTYTDYQRQRLLVKAGLTCYWQTRQNRDTIGFDEWIDLDLLYIRKCGIWTDFKLIVQTIGVVLTAQGS
ncbi:MAG: sugar transferase [Atopobiaceae bacterium]|nr:sugar transferase [Atopobiaceae bacterium]